MNIFSQLHRMTLGTATYEPTFAYRNLGPIFHAMTVDASATMLLDISSSETSFTSEEPTLYCADA